MTVISKGTSISSTSLFYKRVDRYATLPKGREPAPYLTLQSVVESREGPGNYYSSLNNSSVAVVQSVLSSGHPVRTECTNKAYERLKGKVYDSMQLASNVIEGRETLKMLRGVKKREIGGLKVVSNAVNTLVRSAATFRNAFKALRSGKFKSFRKILGVKAKGKHKDLTWSRPRDASGLWLEYHFGWKPLVQDIYNASRILTGTIGHGLYRGSAMVTGSLKDNSNPFFPTDGSWVCKVAMRAAFTLVNPNAFLREQAGLNNPAAWAWEALTMSFLVDWFTNISQCLNAMSDFTGLAVKHASTSFHCAARSVNSNLPPVATYEKVTARAVEFFRSIGLAGPTLRMSLPNGLSVTRGATAISLVVQLFSPRK